MPGGGGVWAESERSLGGEGRGLGGERRGLGGEMGLFWAWQSGTGGGLESETLTDFSGSHRGAKLGALVWTGECPELDWKHWCELGS